MVLLIASGCGVRGDQCGPSAQCANCKAYVTCAEATGAVKGSLDSSYGASGSCWTTTTQADDCTRACNTGLLALQAQFPDAGCKDK